MERKIRCAASLRRDLLLHPHKADGGRRIRCLMRALAHHLSLHRHGADGGGFRCALGNGCQDRLLAEGVRRMRGTCRTPSACRNGSSPSVTQGGTRCARLPWADLQRTFGAEDSVRGVGEVAESTMVAGVGRGGGGVQRGSPAARLQRAGMDRRLPLPRSALAALVCPGLACSAPSVRKIPSAALGKSPRRARGQAATKGFCAC
jgi:hypothetical protein